MFGSRSLEQKLREGKGTRARATVLTVTKGIHWIMNVRINNGLPAGTDLQRHRYTLSVAPEGEEPFEAKIVIRANQLEFLGLDSHSLAPGKTAWVLYDPNDHSRIAFEAYGASQSRCPRRRSS